MNPAKTQCIFIGNLQLLSHITLDTIFSFDRDSIHPSIHVKNHVISMDCYATFDVHVRELNKKLVGILLHKSIISSNFKKRTHTIIVQSIVLSIINHCIKLSSPVNKILMENISKFQHKVAKVSVGVASKYDHVSATTEQLT